MYRKQPYNGKSNSLIARKLVEPETKLAALIPRIKREIAWLKEMPVQNICEIKLMPVPQELVAGKIEKCSDL